MAIISIHALDPEIGAVNRVVGAFFGLAGGQRQEAVELDLRRFFHPGDFQRGGHDILHINGRRHGLARRHARPGHQQRHAQAAVIQVLFAHKAVLAVGQPIV